MPCCSWAFLGALARTRSESIQRERVQRSTQKTAGGPCCTKKMAGQLSSAVSNTQLPHTQLQQQPSTTSSPAPDTTWRGATPRTFAALQLPLSITAQDLKKAMFCYQQLQKANEHLINTGKLVKKEKSHSPIVYTNLQTHHSPVTHSCSSQHRQSQKYLDFVLSKGWLMLFLIWNISGMN